MLYRDLYRWMSVLLPTGLVWISIPPWKQHQRCKLVHRQPHQTLLYTWSRRERVWLKLCCKFNPPTTTLDSYMPEERRTFCAFSLPMVFGSHCRYYLRIAQNTHAAAYIIVMLFWSVPSNAPCPLPLPPIQNWFLLHCYVYMSTTCWWFYLSPLVDIPAVQPTYYS